MLKQKEQKHIKSPMFFGCNVFNQGPRAEELLGINQSCSLPTHCAGLSWAWFSLYSTYVSWQNFQTEIWSLQAERGGSSLNNVLSSDQHNFLCKDMKEIHWRYNVNLQTVVFSTPLLVIYSFPEPGFTQPTFCNYFQCSIYPRMTYYTPCKNI